MVDSASSAPKAPVPYDDSYKWPKNLHLEMRDMANFSFFVYTFSYVLDAARKEKNQGREFVGIKSDGNGLNATVSSATSSLGRTFTPMELHKLIEDNVETLAKYYESDFTEPTLSQTYRNLKVMEDEVTEAGNRASRPITMTEFDDKFQTNELVYAVVKDSIHKRITLIFRGTTNSLAFKSNWATNASIIKKSIPPPLALKGKIDHDIRFHTGFYDYFFDKTKDQSDAPDATKFDQILADIKPLLKAYPDHKLYVTGHSLGAALSTVASFFLSLEPDIPKPVSNINFASPRVGDETFFKAMQYLEKTKQVRVLRAVNHNDLVTVAPSVGYDHVGFQVTLYEKGWFGQKAPTIHHPNINASWFNKMWIGYQNSFIHNLNIGYDHGSYRERVKAGKIFL